MLIRGFNSMCNKNHPPLQILIAMQTDIGNHFYTSFWYQMYTTAANKLSELSDMPTALT